MSYEKQAEGIPLGRGVGRRAWATAGLPNSAAYSNYLWPGHVFRRKVNSSGPSSSREVPLLSHSSIGLGYRQHAKNGLIAGHRNAADRGRRHLGPDDGNLLRQQERTSGCTVCPARSSHDAGPQGPPRSINVLRYTAPGFAKERSPVRRRPGCNAVVPWRTKSDPLLRRRAFREWRGCGTR